MHVLQPIDSIPRDTKTASGLINNSNNAHKAIIFSKNFFSATLRVTN